MTRLQILQGGRTGPNKPFFVIRGDVDDVVTTALAELMDRVRGTHLSTDIRPAKPSADYIACQSFAYRFEPQHAPLDTAQNARIWTTLISALPGITYATAKSLHVRIVGVEELSASLIDKVIALAALEHRKAPLIIASPELRDGLGDIEAALVRSVPDAKDARLITARQATMLMARNKLPGDLLIASRRDAEVIAALGHELAGSVWIASHLEVDALEAQASVEGAQLYDDAPAVEAIIRAGIDALVIAGELGAAALLCNALYKALEDNLHTEQARHSAPYTLELSELEFIEAVVERLGQQPQHPMLHPQRSASAPVDKAEDPPHGLKLVHSA
ncbi:MAG: hypothetical protein AAF607_14130 [Pseudomonadota bacterium]